MRGHTQTSKHEQALLDYPGRIVCHLLFFSTREIGLWRLQKNLPGSETRLRVLVTFLFLRLSTRETGKETALLHFEAPARVCC